MQAPKVKTDKPKNKGGYLNALRERSRNDAANALKTDKRNYTVGKL